MKNLSFTQEFFICALKPQGNTTLTNSVERFTCLVAGGLMELLLHEYVTLENKKVIIKKELTPEKVYLNSIYELIKNNKPMKLEYIAEKYVFAFNKLPDELFKSIGMSLVEDGYVTVESNSGLFKNKDRFIPEEKEVTKVVEKLRAEFLEEGNVTDEVIVLGALFHKSGLIKQYFSKYEIQKLGDRLSEIKNSEAGVIVKQIMDYIELWIALIPALGSGV
jgi:hypothetical protein